MGKHTQKLYSFRADDELMLKVGFIAEYNTRTRNKEIEHLLKNHVVQFESTNGEILINENGTMELAKPKLEGKSINSQKKSG